MSGTKKPEQSQANSVFRGGSIKTNAAGYQLVHTGLIPVRSMFYKDLTPNLGKPRVYLWLISPLFWRAFSFQ